MSAVNDDKIDLALDGKHPETETLPSPDGDEPNEYEKSTLRRVGENLPVSAYLIAVVELTERFTYYGAQGLFQNYINNKRNGADGAKGLGMGHQAATGLNLFFQWFCYGMFTPQDLRWPPLCRSVLG